MKYAIITLGCKVNQYESASLATLLNGRGHEEADAGNADAVIINTCAVTGESSRKSRQAVRRAKTLNGGAIIAVCGCFSQVEPTAAEQLGADIIFGSGEKAALLDELERKLNSRGAPVLKIPDISRKREFELLPGGIVEGRARATLKVEDGCDRFCTYCVIPLARGRVRSMPPAEAAAAARRLADEGYRELVITGIEIASYGKDLDSGAGLASLVEGISLAAPELRLRLGSLEPGVVDEEFAARLRDTGRVCPHFHLSLQSGSDDVLKMMGRRYTTEEFYAAVELLRRCFPDCAIAADLITGFPGETEANHRETLDFIRRCRFSAMHIFPYSSRPGTRAASMPGALTREIKAERARGATMAARESEREYLDGQVGKTLEVLFETGEKIWRGHAGNYTLVEARGEGLRGVVKNVKIDSVRGEILVGRLFDK